MLKYDFIRTAQRDGVCMGQGIYARCPLCGDMVKLLPGEECACGSVSMREASPGKLYCAGGDGPVELYRIVDVPDRQTEMGVFTRKSSRPLALAGILAVLGIVILAWSKKKGR